MEKADDPDVFGSMQVGNGLSQRERLDPPFVETQIDTMESNGTNIPGSTNDDNYRRMNQEYLENSDVDGPPNPPAADEVALEARESTKDFVVRIRQRAEETRGDYRAVPRFNYTYNDTENLVQELNEWFDFTDDALLKDAKGDFLNSLRKYAKQTGSTSDWNSLPTHHKEQFIKGQLDYISSDDGSKRRKGLLVLNHIALGTSHLAENVNNHISMITENCKLLWIAGVFPRVYERCRECIDECCPENLTEERNLDDDSELVLALTVAYTLIEVLRSEDGFADYLDSQGPHILEYLVAITSRLRWSLNGRLPFKQILLLTWKCILCLFGSTDQLESVKGYVREHLNLPKEGSVQGTRKDEELQPDASPLDYHAFRQDITSRYPSYIPPPSVLPDTFENQQSISHYIQVPRPTHMHTQNVSLPAPTIHIATPAPSPPSSPAIAAGQKVRKSVFMTNQSFPFLYPSESADEVPESIVEAGEIFASRIRTTPAMVQLWNERDKFMQHERGWVPPVDKSEIPSNGHMHQIPETAILARIDRFYKAVHCKLGAYINVISRIMLNSISFANSDDTTQIARAKEIKLKAISSILLLLLRWFRTSHVLKFECLSSILFDSRYYLLFFKFLYSHNPLDRALYIPDSSDLSFFTIARKLSDHAEEPGKYGATALTHEGLIASSEAQFVDSIETFSNRYLFAVINFTRILRKIIKFKTQRVITVAELPSDTLKKNLTIYHPLLWRTTLDIFKEQVPYNGRKWKFNNMDLVSAIYLNCKPKLRDDWLVGTDVTAEVDDAVAQEVALRALIKFYHETTIDQEPAKTDDEKMTFFARELEGLNLGF